MYFLAVSQFVCIIKNMPSHSNHPPRHSRLVTFRVMLFFFTPQELFRIEEAGPV